MDSKTIQAIYTHLGIPESSLNAPKHALPTSTSPTVKSPSQPAPAAVVYVSFLRDPDTFFDMDYFLNHHMPLIQKHWAPRGLKTWDVIKFSEGDKSGLSAQCIMVWESREAVEKCIKTGGPGMEEIKEDGKRYTDNPGEMWIGEVC